MPSVDEELIPTHQLESDLGQLLAPLQNLAVEPLRADRNQVIRAGWQLLCDAGVTGVLAPSRFGGQGHGITEAVEWSRVLTSLGCGVPFLSSAVHATRLAEQAGDGRLLAELTTGDRIATVAVTHDVLIDHDRGLLTGTLTDVLHGSDADVWLVAARSERGWSLFAIDRPCENVETGEDPTRPVVTAHMVSAPARLVQADCEWGLRVAAQHAEVVRAAEIVAAAQGLLTTGPAEARLLGATRSLIDFAAACADMDGALKPETVEALRHWTSRVSLAATLASRSTFDDVSYFLAARAGQRSGWTSPEPSAAGFSPSPRNQRLSAVTTRGAGS